MHEINWPAGYIPGFADNFASDEAIVAGLSVADVWPQLENTDAWPGYCSNATDIRFHDGSGPRVSAGARFRFMTFGFPLEAEVIEYVPARGDQPARAAWHGWVEGDAQSRLDVHHAWLLEDLSGERVRILAQETLNGVPTSQLATTRPNPMINGHREWLDGMIAAARATLSSTR